MKQGRYFVWFLCIVTGVMKTTRAGRSGSNDENPKDMIPVDDVISEGQACR